MDDSNELALVRKAILSRLGGCLEWLPKVADRLRKDPWLQGLTPEGIQEELVNHVEQGGEVFKREEARPEYGHREFFYCAIIPYQGVFRRGLFVEMELSLPDPDYPVVSLVNAHEQQ